MGESIDVPVAWSGRPSPESVPVPAAVASLAGGRSMAPVWLNEVGGLTYEIADGAERCFVKWAPAGSEPDLDLAAEADRMEWACQFHPGDARRAADGGLPVLVERREARRRRPR